MKEYTISFGAAIFTAVILSIICLTIVEVSKELNNGTPSAPTEPAQDYTEVEMNVSAYCPCEKCCGEFADGITASGIPAKGRLIAAPKKYSFGTRMDVPGYGTALVEDRGGAIKGNKIDLLFPTHQEALNWGRQYLTVKVYK